MSRLSWKLALPEAVTNPPVQLREIPIRRKLEVCESPVVDTPSIVRDVPPRHELEASHLPKRNGLRYCLATVLCCWSIVAAGFAATYVATRPLPSIAFDTVTERPLPPRNASEQRRCALVGFVTLGKATTLQVRVGLSMVFDRSIVEEDVAVERRADRFFDISIAHCSAALQSAIETNADITSRTLMKTLGFSVSLSAELEAV